MRTNCEPKYQFQYEKQNCGACLMNERECPALGTNMRAMAILGLRKYIILLHKNNEKVL